MGELLDRFFEKLELCIKKKTSCDIIKVSQGVIHKGCLHKFGNFWDPPSSCPDLSTFG